MLNWGSLIVTKWSGLFCNNYQCHASHILLRVRSNIKHYNLIHRLNCLIYPTDSAQHHSMELAKYLQNVSKNHYDKYINSVPSICMYFVFILKFQLQLATSKNYLSWIHSWVVIWWVKERLHKKVSKHNIFQLFCFVR